MLKMVCFVVFIDNIQYHPIIHTSHYPLIRPTGWSGDRGLGGVGKVIWAELSTKWG